MAINVLITGANRGIGRGLAEIFLSRPNHTLFAGVRDITSATSKSLLAFPAAAGSSVQLVRIENTSDSDAADAIKAIQAAGGVDHLDIVIANAARKPVHERIEDTDVEELRRQYEANTLSVVKLYKAAYPLLKASPTKRPVFVAVSSEASSIQNLEANTPYLLAGYGSSKCAVNYLVRRAHFENEWLVAFVVDPGFAQTDMGNEGAKHFGFEQAFVPVKDSVQGIVGHIDGATREKTSGTFLRYDGTEVEY